MCDEVFSAQVAERIFELHQLNKEVMFGIELWRTLRTLKVKGKPFLDPVHFGALGKVEKEHQVEAQGCRQDAIPAKKVDLDLHRVTEPSENIDIIPALFIVSTRRVIVDADLMMEALIQLWIKVRLEDVV